MRLYLTRHGQTLWNLEGRFQGWNDSPLSEKGKSNAKALGERLKDICFYEVYSSSVGRAMDTACIISGIDSKQLIQDDDLREINLGSWEGKSVKEVKEKFPKEYDDFWHNPHLYKRVGSESYYDVQKRALKSINKIIDKNKNTERNILVVTHTITLKTIMAYFENRDFKNLWDAPFIYDTSLSLVEINNNRSKIILHGDISHLPDLEGYEFLKKSEIFNDKLESEVE